MRVTEVLLQTSDPVTADVPLGENRKHTLVRNAPNHPDTLRLENLPDLLLWKGGNPKFLMILPRQRSEFDVGLTRRTIYAIAGRLYNDHLRVFGIALGFRSAPGGKALKQPLQGHKGLLRKTQGNYSQVCLYHNTAIGVMSIFLCNDKNVGSDIESERRKHEQGVK